MLTQRRGGGGESCGLAHSDRTTAADPAAVHRMADAHCTFKPSSTIIGFYCSAGDEGTQQQSSSMCRKAPLPHFLLLSATIGQSPQCPGFISNLTFTLIIITVLF